MSTSHTIQASNQCLRGRMDEFASRVSVSFTDPLPVVFFRRLVLDTGAHHIRHLEWATVGAADVRDLPTLCTSQTASEHRWLFEFNSVLVRLHIRDDGWAWASLAAEDPGALEPAVKALLERFPRAALEPLDDGRHVPITFWAASTTVPWRSVRMLPVPSWTEICANYTSATRVRLEALMSDFSPGHGGQLLLWHGPPGTGKTFALRALAREWSAWCDVHLVTDPEAFLGSRPEYMLEVLMDSGGWGGFEDPDFPHEFQRSRDLGSEEARWRLVVLEDTGELLEPDAKAVTGQALSRLLNMVDGLLGQGTRLLILITTNEPVRTWHSAVSRPGRCAANVEFAALSSEEAREWLETRQASVAASGTATIAELYRGLAGGPPASGATIPLGFG